MNKTGRSWRAWPSTNLRWPTTSTANSYTQYRVSQLEWLNMFGKYVNRTVKIASEITVGFKFREGTDPEPLCQDAFIVFFILRQGRSVWDANDQPLISNMVHHLAVGCIEVCQRVDAPTLELFLILVAAVQTDEPLSQSTLHNRDALSSQLKAFKLNYKLSNFYLISIKAPPSYNERGKTTQRYDNI